MRTVLVFFLALVLVSCDDSNYEQTKEAFEYAALLEEQKSNKEMIFGTFHEEEDALYKEIVEKSEDDVTKAFVYIQEAKRVISKNETTLQKELLLIQKLKNEETHIARHIDKIANKKSKQQAEKAFQLYKERLLYYNDLLHTYKKSLQAEKELYSLMENKASLSTLRNKINEINRYYETCNIIATQFQETTTYFNDIYARL